MQHKNKQREINKGKFSVLVLALSGALAAMAPVHSQAQQVSWTSGNLDYSSADTITSTWVSAIDASGTVGTLTNNGILSSSNANGINNTGTITAITNNNTIQGGSGVNGNSAADGIRNSGLISTLTNTGTISGNKGIDNSGTISTLTNSGTVSGGSMGVYVASSGNIGTLNNTGLISSATAITLMAGSSLGTFINTGTIAGAIQNYTATALTISGGSGSTYGTLTGASGGISASDISLIHSYSGLTLNGNQLLNDNIDVSNGSSPLVLNTVTNNGVLQINNPLTITGNYVQGSGSTLVIGVVNPVFNGALTDSGYGRLVVKGDATLDASTVTIKSVSYALAQGQRYVVVAATGAISDTGVTYSASGYTVTGTTQTDSSNSSYTDLVLTLGASSGSSGSGSGAGSSSSPINHATTSNAVSALSGLFKYSGTDATMLALFNPAAALDTASANKAGAQLSPAAVNSGALHAVDATTQAVNNVTNSHLDGFRVAQAGSSGVATGESSRDIALWGQVFGGRASQGLRDNISGYHANYRGLLIGADALVTDTLRAGALVSAGKTAIASDGDNTGSSANVNSYNLTAYATYSGSPWYFNALAGAARQQYSTVRAISYTGFSGVADGSFTGLQYTTAVQAGYPLNLDAWLPGATLTPIAGLSYNNLRQNGYTETGGNGAALNVNASSTSSLKSELGAKLENSFATSYGKLLPSVQLGWRHEYKDGRVQTGASFVADSTGSTAFVTQGASAVRNVGVLNLGVTLLQGQRLSLTAKYTLESGGGYLAQTGSMQARWQY